uniref:Spermatosis associated 24 n=1 Tax=Dromaius novaehollandiae TaxID=8790 RepID=A0A8C4J6Y6_DRONO
PAGLREMAAEAAGAEALLPGQLRRLAEAQAALTERLRRRVMCVPRARKHVKLAWRTRLGCVLQEEESAHARTKDLLTKESEKLDFALGEVEVLSRQLKREKQIFEKTLDSVKSKALAELTQKDKLINKCNEIKSHIVKQEDVLKDKENEIQALQRCITQQKRMLKCIQKQQELYIAQVLEKKQRKGFK